MTLEYLKISLKNLRSRKLRSYLTMLGIIIGIATVVALISLGNGLQNALDEQFRELGADKIIVSPPGGQTTVITDQNNPLTQRDIDTIKRVPGIQTAGGVRFRAAQIEWGRNDIGFYPVIAIPTDESQQIIQEVLQLEPIQGRQLRQGDTSKAIIGYDYENFEGFETNIRIGRTITINQQRFEVIGINQRLGSELDDRSVFIIQDAYKQLFTQNEQYNQILVQVTPGRTPSELVEPIQEALRRDRNQQRGQEDFEVETFENVINSFLDIFLIVQTVIIGVASISLLVGGIGIMNTMYTSVIERTKEIGTMKAIGAKNSAIQSIFLFESGLLGLTGGIIGATLGIGFAKIVELAALNALGQAFLIIKIEPTLIIGALIFSFSLGLFSGYLPAKQASKLNPVDALRGAE